jgi:hypothetical protein
MSALQGSRNHNLARAMRVSLGLFGIMLMLTARAVAQLAPVIDNERVTVWDVLLNSGTPGPATPHDLDCVVMFLEGGSIRTVDADGSSRVTKRAFGDAVFVAKGRDAKDTVVSADPAHEIVVALKDFTLPALVNTSPYPAAFPRPGSAKALENNRVVVWHYSWTVGVATPMHFHDKDIVVAYRYDGALKSVTPEGAAVVNTYKAGDVRFNKANRAHYEELPAGRQSAVMMELK